MFHGSFVLLVAVGAAIVLAPGAPLGIATVGVHTLAGVLLPSATVFLLLLCNDPAVLGPWTNPRWLNVIATAIVAVLIELSALLIVTTLFPDLDIRALAVGLAAVLVAVLVGLAVSARPLRRESEAERPSHADRLHWTMPPCTGCRRPNGPGLAPSRSSCCAPTCCSRRSCCSSSSPN